MNLNIHAFWVLSLCLSNLIEAKDLKFSFEDIINNDPKSNWTWFDVQNLIKKLVDVYTVPNLRSMMRIEAKMNLSEPCQEAIQKIVFGMRKVEPWVIQMADASGRLPAGLLDGTMMDFGSFDECLRIRANSSKQELFRGKYCMIGYYSPMISSMSKKTPEGQSYIEAYGEPPPWIMDILKRGDGFLNTVGFWFGTCIPSTCTRQDVHNIFNTISHPLGVEARIADCQTDEPRLLEKYEIISISLLGFILWATAAGTLFDLVSHAVSRNRTSSTVSIYRRTRMPLLMLKSFSLLSNTKRLFQGGSGSSPLSCYNGMRFLSATWVILGHTYFYTDTWKYLKYSHLWGLTDQFNKHFPAAVIENFSIPVGTFFFMSGCLIVYTNWPKLEESGGKINVIYFFIHRFWRMTPALALMIVLLFGLPLIDSGPLWFTNLKPEIELCQKNWWRNILYISNFWDSDDICMIHTWYLSALMQYHVIAVVLLLLIFRWPIFGLIMGMVVLVGSCIWTGLLVVSNDFPMPVVGMVKDLSLIKDYNSVIYVKPFAHIGSYIVGMITGWILLRYQKVKLLTVHLVLGWIAAILCGLTSVYGIYGPADLVQVRAIYIALHRIAWAAALGWITFVCAIGQGGLINRFLSWRAFHSLGQLSYLAYLLHPLVIIYRTASLKERVYYGHTELVFSYFGNVVVGFFLAYLGYVSVEMPCGTLEALALFRRKTSSFTNGRKAEESLVKTVVVKQRNGV